MKYLLTIFPFFLVACGGGGGGDSSSNSNTVGNLPKTGVRFIQASLDAPSIDIYRVGEVTSLQTSAFGAPAGYVALAEGEFSFQLNKAKSTETLATVPVSLAKGERKTVVFAGDYRVPDVAGFLINDTVEPTGSGEAKIRIINAVQGLRAVAAKVGASDEEVVTLGAASTYVTVPAGLVTYSVTSKLGGVTSGSLTVEGGKPYSILVTGEKGYFIHTALLVG